MSSMSISLRLHIMSDACLYISLNHLRVTSWGDKIEKSMDTAVLEARVTLDPGLLRQNVVVLTLEVVGDFLETDTKELITSFAAK